MDTVERLIYVSWLFRIIVMLVGLIVILIGVYFFKMARGGGNAGSLSAGYKDVGKLSIKGVAGLFFIVLGTIIILAGLFRRSEFTWSKSAKSPAGQQSRESIQGTGETAPVESTETFDGYPARDSAIAR